MTRSARRRGSRSNLGASDNGTTSHSTSEATRDFSPNQPRIASQDRPNGQLPDFTFSLLDTKADSDPTRRNGSESSRFTKRSESKPSTTDYVFPPANINRWEFQNRTANELERLAKNFRYGKTRRSLTRKAQALRACGARTRVKACVDCGASCPGSGVQCSPGHRCSLRICPICHHADSERCVAELSPVVERLIDSSSLPERKGYAFRSGTLTAKYNPADPNDLSPEALRDRALGLQASLNHAWRKLSSNSDGWSLRCPGAGLVYSIEPGISGNVHIHFVHYGPNIPKAEFERTVREAYADAGFSFICKISGDTKDVTTENRAQLKHAVCEALRYTFKAPSPLNELWFDGVVCNYSIKHKSGSVPAVVIEQAPQTFTASHNAFPSVGVGRWRLDDAIVQSLVIPFLMKMNQILR